MKEIKKTVKKRQSNLSESQIEIIVKKNQKNVFENFIDVPNGFTTTPYTPNGFKWFKFKQLKWFQSKF